MKNLTTVKILKKTTFVQILSLSNNLKNMFDNYLRITVVTKILHLFKLTYFIRYII